jgi:hypothetical protein
LGDSQAQVSQGAGDRGRWAFGKAAAYPNSGRTFAEAFLLGRADAAVVKVLRDIYERVRPRSSNMEAS